MRCLFLLMYTPHLKEPQQHCRQMSFKLRKPGWSPGILTSCLVSKGRGPLGSKTQGQEATRAGPEGLPGSGVLVSKCCRTKYHKLGGSGQQIGSWFWRLEIANQDVARAIPPLKLTGEPFLDSCLLPVVC